MTSDDESLLARLRSHLRDPVASSFQLMGEDLTLLGPGDLRAAADAWEAALARVPADLRAAFDAEQRALRADAHAFLRRYNTSLYSRVAGYLALGRRFGFEYPWPVVAVLGICTVLDGMTKMRVYGLLGRAAASLGAAQVERASERIDDLLRRTNRGIFADSVPVALLALRCHALRREGKGELAQALLDGPLPLLMDDECRDLARRLALAFAIEDGARRFEALSALTLVHFGREQAVFTHHLGCRKDEVPRPYATWVDAAVGNPGAVDAPCVVSDWRGRRRLVFRKHALPADFDIRAHAPRVDVFGRAFVSSITGSVEDYQAAVDHALGRFGADGERVALAYPARGTPLREA